MGEKIKVIILGFAHAVDHSFLLAIPPILPNIAQSLRLEVYEMGFITSLAYFLFGFGSIFAGILARRISSEKLIFLSLLLSGFSLFMLIAPESTMIFALALSVNSLWAGIYHPVSNKLISETFHQKTGQIMGFHGVGGNVGAALVPMISLLIAQYSSWKNSLIFFGILAIISSFGFITDREEKSSNENKKLKVKISWGKFRWIIILSIMMGLFARGAELFLPSLLLERGFDQTIAALTMSLLLFSGILGQLLGGYLSDRHGSRKMLLIAAGMTSLGMFTISLSFTDMVGAVFGVIIYGFAIYAIQPPSTVLQSELSNKEERGAIYGVYFFLTFSLGAVSTSVSGFIAGKLGLECSYGFIALLTLIALVASIKLFKHKSNYARIS